MLIPTVRKPRQVPCEGKKGENVICQPQASSWVLKPDAVGFHLAGTEALSEV